jgi:hypothetical protein
MDVKVFGLYLYPRFLSVCFNGGLESVLFEVICPGCHLRPRWIEISFLRRCYFFSQKLPWLCLSPLPPLPPLPPPPPPPPPPPLLRNCLLLLCNCLLLLLRNFLLLLRNCLLCLVCDGHLTYTAGVAGYLVTCRLFYRCSRPRLLLVHAIGLPGDLLA